MCSIDFSNYNIATPTFSLNGYETYARVVDVYDGDTVTLVLPIYDSFFKFHVRLHGIDACEIHSHQDTVKKMSIKARNRLIEIITSLIDPLSLTLTRKDIQKMLNDSLYLVWIKCYKFDKYGRLLADVFTHNKTKNISTLLLEEELVIPYDGKTRKTEDEQKLFFS